MLTQVSKLHAVSVRGGSPDRAPEFLSGLLLSLSQVSAPPTASAPASWAVPGCHPSTGLGLHARCHPSAGLGLRARCGRHPSAGLSPRTAHRGATESHFEGGPFPQARLQTLPSRRAGGVGKEFMKPRESWFALCWTESALGKVFLQRPWDSLLASEPEREPSLPWGAPSRAATEQS